MAPDRLKAWEALFERALNLIDSVGQAGLSLDDWSFGGGTVLMLEHQHRFSKDIDIFVSDPQYLNYLSPRLNSVAERMTGDYIEQGNFLKLQFKEGEIDFVASAALTENPTKTKRLFDRDVKVETSAEIVAKKVWHRGETFKARDILDLSMVIENEPEALIPIQPILRDRREAIRARIDRFNGQLRQDFGELDILKYTRPYDECVLIVKRALENA